MIISFLSIIITDHFSLYNYLYILCINLVIVLIVVNFALAILVAARVRKELQRCSVSEAIKPQIEYNYM